MLEPVPQWLYSFATHCRRRWAHVGNILRHDSANDFRCQRSLSHLTWVQFPQFPRPPPKRLSPVAVALWWSDLRELRSESYVPIWDPWAVGCGRCGRGPAAFAASLSRSCREHRIKWLKIYICAAYSIVLLLLPQGLMVEKLQPELPFLPHWVGIFASPPALVFSSTSAERLRLPKCKKKNKLQCSF